MSRRFWRAVSPASFPKLSASPTATALIREPVFVYGATSAELLRTHQRAITRALRVAIYTEPLFRTTDDFANRAEVAAHPTEALDLVGLGLHADRKTIDKVTAGLKFLD
jgi:hypothetical protein